MKYALVFFCELPPNLGPPRQRFLAQTVQCLSLSRMSHCAIGYRRAVCNAALSGVDYYELPRYVRHYPGLVAAVRAPLLYPIDLDRFAYYVGVPISPFPTFFRWLRLGKANYVYDCLGVVATALLWGGVPVPRLASVAGLFRWLRKEGYPYVERRPGEDEQGFRRATQFLCARRTDG